MPRKGIISRRAQATDPVYGSDLVEKFICSMMWEGKNPPRSACFMAPWTRWQEEQRRRAETFQEGCGERQAGTGSEDATRGRRELSGAGGSESVPAAVAGHSLALQYSRERAGKTMVDKLADELIDAANARGGAMKKKEDVHRMRKRTRLRALSLVKVTAGKK